MSPALARAESLGSSAACTARNRKSGTRATMSPTWKSPTSASSALGWLLFGSALAQTLPNIPVVAVQLLATSGMVGSDWARAEPNSSHPSAEDNSDHDASGPGV